MKKLILILCLCATAIASAATAVSQTFSWDPSTSAVTNGPPIGYKFYQRIGTNAPTVLSLLTGTTLQYTVNTIQPGGTNLFSFWVTALTAEGESLPSNVVTAKAPPLPVSSPPQNLRNVSNAVMLQGDNGAARLMFFSGRRSRARQ